MARKPALTDSSFLASIFRPGKNAIPAGLRKRQVVKTPGRSAARVRSFNRLTPAQQAILDRAGKREDYLRGTTTLAKAKGALREQAVQLGIVRPPKVPKVSADRTIHEVVLHVARVTGKTPNTLTIATNVSQWGTAPYFAALTRSDFSGNRKVWYK